MTGNDAHGRLDIDLHLLIGMGFKHLLIDKKPTCSQISISFHQTNFFNFKIGNRKLVR
jgi:hypothetical protein